MYWVGVAIRCVSLEGVVVGAAFVRCVSECMITRGGVCNEEEGSGSVPGITALMFMVEVEGCARPCDTMAPGWSVGHGTLTDANRGQVFNTCQASKSFQSVSAVSMLSKSTASALGIDPRWTPMEARRTRVSWNGILRLAACSISPAMTTLNLRISSPMASNCVLTAVWEREVQRPSSAVSSFLGANSTKL